MHLVFVSSTIGMVDGDGVLRSPPADGILDSTTWRRASQLSSGLVERGLLSACKVEAIIVDDLNNASEILSFGGGWVEPVRLAN